MSKLSHVIDTSGQTMSCNALGVVSMANGRQEEIGFGLPRVSEALCVGSTDCSDVETTWCGSQAERYWGYSFKLFMYLCIYFRMSVVGGHHITWKVFSVKLSLSNSPSLTLLTYLLPQLNLFWFHYSNLIFKYRFI